MAIKAAMMYVNLLFLRRFIAILLSGLVSSATYAIMF